MATSPQSEGAWEFQTRGEAALAWFGFGYSVIPVAPGAKQAAVRWEPWLAELGSGGAEAIRQHWQQHPNDDVAFVVGTSQLVLDTDSPEATAALWELERRHGVPPLMVVETERGEHHHFAMSEDVFVRSDSHDGKRHPERIDVKAQRSMVNLPPSGVRRVSHCHVGSAGQLTEVDQDFVDAVFRHNGRSPPRPSPERDLLQVTVDEPHLAKLERLLAHIDPNCGYADWLQVMMAVFHESKGGEAGFALADAWSAPGETYPGSRALRDKWSTFSLTVANPVTIGTLIKRAAQEGADIDQIVGDRFEVLPKETEIVLPEPEPLMAAVTRTPLDRYSLRGRLDELRREMVQAVALLGAIALAGQITVIFAGPGTGKTLVILHLALEALRLNSIPGLRFFYINEDDNSQGLYDKAALLEEYEDFHMIAEGHRSFKASDLEDILERMADDGSARRSVIIMDTIKKVVDPMDKKACRQFMKKVRRFCAKGGTFIGLAHVNKNPDAHGNPIAAGTSDIRDDADCTYILSEIEGGETTNEKFVLFRNTKRRGNNALNVAYGYTLDRDIKYADLLLSVRELEPEGLAPTKRGAEPASDNAVIEVVRACIAEGICTKMKLANEVRARVGISRALAGKIIDRHTGDDPLEHRWCWTVGPRGAQVYRLLEPAPGDPPDGDG